MFSDNLFSGNEVFQNVGFQRLIFEDFFDTCRLSFFDLKRLINARLWDNQKGLKKGCF
jgi:hypothetical protein